jgi:hypothetical protein
MHLRHDNVPSEACAPLAVRHLQTIAIWDIQVWVARGNSSGTACMCTLWFHPIQKRDFGGRSVAAWAFDRGPAVFLVHSPILSPCVAPTNYTIMLGVINGFVDSSFDMFLVVGMLYVLWKSLRA